MKLKVPTKMFEKIEVDWEDSVMDQSGWVDINNYDFDGHLVAMKYFTSGYFVRKIENALFICQSFRPDGQACGIISIPFTAIKRIIKVT